MKILLCFTPSVIGKKSVQYCYLVFLLVFFNTILLRAQNVQNYNFYANSGTYSTLSGTTLSLSGGNTDEGWYNAIPIGFAFNYCGVSYTYAHISTNGWMTFGTSPSNNIISNASLLNNLTSGGTRPLIAPLWDDLNIQTPSNFSYTVNGSSPARVFTAEWLNVRWNNAATGNTISFQVKLYETSNKIEFIYRQESGTVLNASASIGICNISTGSGNFLSLNGTGSNPGVSSTTETTTLNLKPANGQKYIFTPPQALPYCVLFSENFESLAIGNLPSTGTSWRTYDVVTSVNNWSIGDNTGAINGLKSLTISNYTYNKTDNANKVAYFATKINALNFHNLNIDFKWKCLGEANIDYGMLVWSTDGMNWQSVTNARYSGQTTTQNITNLDISVCDNKEFYIGFRWINNASGGTNPPFSLDDIFIKGTPYLQYSFSYRQDLYKQLSGGTSIMLDANGGATVSMPFLFKYADKDYTKIRVSRNGWIKMDTMDPGIAYENGLGNLANTSFLAPLWDSLTYDMFSSMVYNTLGTSPNRVFCVEWRNMLWGNARQNFQVKLSETTGLIEFCYGQMMEPLESNATIGINDGNYCGSRFLSITPQYTPSVSLYNSNDYINSTVFLNNGLVYVFNPQAMQNYSTWQGANIVVGQPNFTTNNGTASQTIAAGANNSSVSSKGVLAVGAYYTNRVLLWNTIPTSNGVAANIVVGQTNFTSTAAGTTASTLYHPYNVAFSPDGIKLLIADAGNNRVLIWNTIPTTNGVPADVVIGQTNFTSSSSGFSSTKLNTPTGILVLPNGKLIITDKNNNRVLIYNSIPTTNGVAADLVIGQNDFSTNTLGSTANKFDHPWDAAYSPEGKLLVSDNGDPANGNHRVLIFNEVPTTNGVSADFVIGNTVFGQKPGSTTRTTFDQPCVTISCEGKVAIADYGNSRIMVYNRVPTSNGAPADIVLGQPDFTTKVSFNDGNNVSGTPSDKNMYYPYSICFDINGRLMVNGTNTGGTGMHRVMVYGVTPTQTADLAISIFSDAVGPQCIGAHVTYTVTVTNNGPVIADHVVINAALPVGFLPITSFTNTGSFNFQSGYWTVPAINVGSSVTLNFTGEITDYLAGNNNVIAYANVLAASQNDNNFSNNGDNEIIAVSNNHAPGVSVIPDVSIPRNSTTGPIPFTISDIETPANNLVLVGSSSKQTIVPNSNIVFGGSGNNRTITVTPLPNQIGEVEITIMILDDVCSRQISFKLTCGNVWKGTISTNWHTPGNWTYGVPTPTVEAIIPTHPVGPNFPIIGSSANCLDLEIYVNSFATFNGSQTLNVYGNLYNDGNFNTSTGTINFIGNIPQNISSGSCVFYNIGFNNNNAGSNDIILLNNMTISHQANFTNGIVNPGSYMVIFTGDNSLVGSSPAPSNNSYINGKARKIGTTPFEFPIGKGGYWAPIAISASGGINNTIDGEYFNTGCANNSPAFMNGLHHVSYSEYWDLTRVAGGNYPDVTLFWKDGSRSGITDLADLRVAHFSGMWDDMGGNVSGTIVSGSISSVLPFTGYSPFSFGSENNPNPLPVELLSFSAVCSDQNVILKWSTASENNCDYFTIEKSLDAINYNFLTSVKATGNSNSVKNYDFVDHKAPEGTSFYRLMQTNFNGFTEILDVKSTDCIQSLNDNIELNNYPNPFNQVITFDIRNIMENTVSVEITDILGKLAARKEIINLQKKDATLQFDLSAFPVGVYYYKLISGTVIKTGKIIKD